MVFILVKQLITTNGLDELFEHSQLVNATWPWAYSALCISSGYFAYDQLDMLIYGLYSGIIPSILLHHFILLGCFTLALYRNVTINYLILTLICEVRVYFLLWLLRLNRSTHYGNDSKPSLIVINSYILSFFMWEKWDGWLDYVMASLLKLNGS